MYYIFGYFALISSIFSRTSFFVNTVMKRKRNIFIILTDDDFHEDNYDIKMYIFLGAYEQLIF